MEGLQRLQQHQSQQLQSLQTIRTEKDTRNGNDDGDEAYDLLRDGRLADGSLKQDKLLSDTQRDLRTYSTNQDQSCMNPQALDLRQKFNELRRELFKEIDIVNVRLQNVENTILLQQGRHFNQGTNANSPQMAAAHGFGAANMAGFADTVKVTFSNNHRVEPETDDKKNKMKGKK